MGSFSIWHWLIVLMVVALVFGTGKLRSIGKDLGSAARDFKEALREEPRLPQAPPAEPAAPAQAQALAQESPPAIEPGSPPPRA